MLIWFSKKRQKKSNSIITTCISMQLFLLFDGIWDENRGDLNVFT